MSSSRNKYINPLTDFGFKKLFEAAEIAKFTKEERAAYEESLKYYRDIKNVVDTSREEGLVEGIEQGFKQGIEQGIEQGIDKRNLEITKMLIQKGMGNKEISEITGLTETKVQQLRS